MMKNQQYEYFRLKYLSKSYILTNRAIKFIMTKGLKILPTAPKQPIYPGSVPKNKYP
jgi:hypothetical protein